MYSRHTHSPRTFLSFAVPVLVTERSWRIYLSPCVLPVPSALHSLCIFCIDSPSSPSSPFTNFHFHAGRIVIPVPESSSGIQNVYSTSRLRGFHTYVGKVACCQRLEWRCCFAIASQAQTQAIELAGSDDGTKAEQECDAEGCEDGCSAEWGKARQGLGRWPLPVNAARRHRIFSSFFLCAGAFPSSFRGLHTNIRHCLLFLYDLPVTSLDFYHICITSGSSGGLLAWRPCVHLYIMARYIVALAHIYLCFSYAPSSSFVFSPLFVLSVSRVSYTVDMPCISFYPCHSYSFVVSCHKPEYILAASRHLSFSRT